MQEHRRLRVSHDRSGVCSTPRSEYGCIPHIDSRVDFPMELRLTAAQDPAWPARRAVSATWIEGFQCLGFPFRGVVRRRLLAAVGRYENILLSRILQVKGTVMPVIIRLE